MKLTQLEQQLLCVALEEVLHSKSIKISSKLTEEGKEIIGKTMSKFAAYCLPLNARDVEHKCIANVKQVFLD